MEDHSSVILSQPYSGALYAFFDIQIRKNHKILHEPITHPYYKNLFGSQFQRNFDLSLTLLTLFDKVILPPADSILPDHQTFYADSKYENHQLGLYTDWLPFTTVRDNFQDRIEMDLLDKIIANYLSHLDDKDKRFELLNFRTELHISKELGVPIISSNFRKRIFDRLIELDQVEDFHLPDLGNQVKLIDEYVNFSGLLFSPKDIDELYEIKTDNEIRLYSSDMLQAIEKSDNDSMNKLLLEAMNKEKFFSRASGIFEVASIVLTLGAFFVPNFNLFGSISAFGSTTISMDLGERARRNRWYQFGNKVKLIKSELDLRKMQKELEKQANK